VMSDGPALFQMFFHLLQRAPFPLSALPVERSGLNVIFIPMAD